MKRILGFVGLGLMAAFFNFGAPMLIGSAEVSAENQWDDAKVELKNSWINETRDSLKKSNLRFPDSMLNSTGVCFASKVAEFLNTTECKYKYVKGVSSEKEHLSEQEACFEKVGFQVNRDAIELECIQLHFGKDWKPYAPAFVQRWTYGLQSPSADTGNVQLAAKCVVDKLMAILTELSCDPVNRETENVNDWLRLPEECLSDKPDSKAKFGSAQTACFDEYGVSPGNQR